MYVTMTRICIVLIIMLAVYLFAIGEDNQSETSVLAHANCILFQLCMHRLPNLFIII